MRQLATQAGASATISREAGPWFTSMMVETDDFTPVRQSHDAIGVDLATLATLKRAEAVAGPGGNAMRIATYRPSATLSGHLMHVGSVTEDHYFAY